MSTDSLVLRAAEAARFQRRRGDTTPMHVLFRRSYSLLRYLHRQWHSRAAGLVL